MAVRRKNFHTKKKGTDDVVILDVNGGDGFEEDGIKGASFRCNSKIPGMVLVDFISEMDEDDPKSMGIGLTSFFEAAVDENVMADFFAYVRDKKNGVELDDLAEMAGWLAEQYTGGNPTVQSQPSSDGSAQSGLGSEDVPSELGSISQPSMASNL